MRGNLGPQQHPVLVVLALVLLVASEAGALDPGDPAPPFELPWLAEQGTARAPEIFFDHPITVLMIWDRQCPHCTAVALASPTLADSIEPLGARLVGIVMGPDDPEVLKDLFWDEQVSVPHLWDSDRATAGPYGLGFQHLGIFVIDRAGTIRAVFDDKVPEPVAPILPAVRAALAVAAAPRSAQAASQPAGWPTLRIDGNTRAMTTEGARYGDIGLFGETVTNGFILLHRWDLRMSWTLVPGLEFEPWLRISNESDVVLTEGAQRLSSRFGSASLRARTGPLSATLGAFPNRIAPLLMQRWDEHDAPPIGGVTGCGVCGAGAAGLQEHSLEVLSPEYTFEGISASYAHRYACLRASVAVDGWEREVLTDAPAEEIALARYRRVIHTGSLDLGRSGLLDPDLGLPRPVGLRLGMVFADDDQRTLVNYSNVVRPPAREELGAVALARIEPFTGLSAAAEFVQWTLRASGRETDAAGWRAGIQGERTLGSYSFWGRLYGISTERDFDPLYRALTYERNRVGWRVSGGGRYLMMPGGTRERIGARFFYRTVEEEKAEEAVDFGLVGFRVASVSLSGRPTGHLLAEVSYLRLSELSPDPYTENATTSGISLDLRWEGWPTVDPTFHLEIVQNDPTGGNPATLYKSYLSVRVVK